MVILHRNCHGMNECGNHQQVHRATSDTKRLRTIEEDIAAFGRQKSTKTSTNMLLYGQFPWFLSTIGRSTTQNLQTNPTTLEPQQNSRYLKSILQLQKTSKLNNLTVLHVHACVSRPLHLISSDIVKVCNSKICQNFNDASKVQIRAKNMLKKTQPTSADRLICLLLWLSV